MRDEMEVRMDGLNPSGEDVREAIFKSAVELFARRGYYATTIRDIVDRAGVTQPMVYYYFGSKEELFVSCVKELFYRISCEYKKVPMEQPIEKYLWEFITVGNDIYAKSPESILLMINYIHYPEEYPRFSDIKELVAKPMEVLKNAIEYARQNGEVRQEINPISASMTVLGALTLARTLHYIHNFIMDIDLDVDTEFVSNQIQKIVTRGILSN
ncbi:hypothetical protein DRQ33_05020 [bacterium]|nr:MAG: hypothetical protein DRQ33_05020 [bacterium]